LQKLQQEQLSIQRQRDTLYSDRLVGRISGDMYDQYAAQLEKKHNVEERRIIISLVLWNLKFDGKNMLWDVRKPFDVIIENCDQQEWCAQ